IMNNHSIMIYPIDIETLFETNKWINAYECYFKNMLGLKCELQSIDAFNFIQQLEVKSRLLCKMLYNVFTISTYQN
ncbi:hypothetical protein NMF36_18925, partial [Acinetobacter baumannii]|uniref:hypothetical protein n=1 Tax=Acinetobacter baumannii TaxID=470 RepID=UPI0020C2BC0D|nr:hypothetical protein [Acinetobacter baumannii]